MSFSEQEMLFMGLDVGSISLNTVLMTPDGAILEEDYTRVHGRPLETTLRVLNGVLERYSWRRIRGVGVTGVAGRLVARLLGGTFFNEVVAQARSVELLAPQARTIIEMGGQDAKLILLASQPGNGRLQIEDFSMNSLCAAGTGSFLDQQANRLGLTIEEFGQMALKSTAPPRIAGRCSVFAKSDMIHLQQAATPDYDIVAGLCFAVARNFKGSVAKGKPLKPPVVFQGGVAANPGMVRAFREILELEEKDLLVPAHFASTGAIGAVLMLLEDPPSLNRFQGLEALEAHIKEHYQRKSTKSLEPLVRPAHVRKGATPVFPLPETGGLTRAFLGVDVGSISTNVVVIDEQGRVLSKRYLMTAGRPLEAVKRGLREVGREVGDKVLIAGAGTTGSGRYLTGDFIGADVIRNEITAQATAAVAIDPKVDTIFEIGGQDSKYISLSHGAVVDFAMNKVCAAGTGSFLEEQAERLGISIQEEFAELALSSKSPVPLGERCTVFMESDLVHHLQRGAPTPDLVAGLAYSIVENYLNKVVETRRIGQHIFFQGGPAFNHAIVAAFEQVLGRPVTVPPHHEVTGAIGAALLAMRENPKDYSHFKGFQLAEKAYQISPFECKACPNRCEIKKVVLAGEEERPLFYGGRCERYEKRRGPHEGARVEIPDLFSQREKLLLETCPDDGPESGPQIGIPRALFFLELLPFWKAFFSSMGFRVVISDPTTKEVIHRGVERVVAETCFPVKVAFGHVENLIQKGIRLLFLPSIIDMRQSREDLPQGFNCPYVQTIPYTVRSAFDFEAMGVKLLAPPLRFGAPRKELHKALMRLGGSLGVKAARIRKAIQAAEEAQERFSLAVKQMGKQALEGLKPHERAMVIVSRVYNGCDSGVNLNLPRKLRDLGVLAIPMDGLPLEGIEPDEEVLGHYWRYGQRFMTSAKLLREDPRLYPIYITNFGCGPDSFIAHFFRNAMGEKPLLQLEIDEHSSDVGAITRLEAFLDSLKHAPARASGPLKPIRRQGLHSIGRDRMVFLPYMTDQAKAVAAAFEASGVPARVLPPTTGETLRVGRRYTSGKECYPAILTTGDMLAWAMSPGFDRSHSAFFMPGGSGPCRFGQYNRFHRLVLDQAGFEDVPIYSPVQDQEMYRQLGLIGKTFVRLGWRGVVAIDFLEKALWEVRPLEALEGQAEKAYEEAVSKVCQELKQGNGDLFPILQEAREAFEAIPRRQDASRPLVGIVGEIYIRSNPFANENVIRQLEQLEVSVWMPPISEWLLYINCISKRHALRDGKWKNYLRTSLKEWFQRRDEHRMEEIFHGLVRNLKEPTIEETMKLAGPYVHSSFEGETILSIGKAEDFYRKGVSGLVSVGPFTCMPGTIVTALLKRFREEHEGIPVLNLFFDGQGETSTQNRLEAFVHQVQVFKNKRQRQR